MEPAELNTLHLNLTQRPLDDIRVRRAIAMAIDRRALVQFRGASAHREAAFESCMFLVDYLKTQAPFWKLEEGGGDAAWVEARESDDRALARWEKTAAGSSST